jgi:hypothetical protein
MSIEVYLLSIPLARHRSIVPRPRRSNAPLASTGVQEAQHRMHCVTDTLVEPPRHVGTMQRIDPG